MLIVKILSDGESRMKLFEWHKHSVKIVRSYCVNSSRVFFTNIKHCKTVFGCNRNCSLFCPPSYFNCYCSPTFWRNGQETQNNCWTVELLSNCRNMSSQIHKSLARNARVEWIWCTVCLFLSKCAPHFIYRLYLCYFVGSVSVDKAHCWRISP